MAFLKHFGRPWLIRQRAAGEIATEVAAERRPTDFDAAWNGPAVGVHALPGLRGVPKPGQIRTAARQPRRRRSQIWFAIGFSRNIRRGMVQPLAGCNGFNANQRDENPRKYVETPHVPPVPLPHVGKHCIASAGARGALPLSRADYARRRPAMICTSSTGSTGLITCLLNPALSVRSRSDARA